MKRVLIVDDKEENLYYLQSLLTAHGWTVDLAHHGAEALVIARQTTPDLVISDLLMPVMDGYTLLSQWKFDPHLKQVPFIVYTATYTEAQDEQLAYSLGADAFILKPAEPDDFIASVYEVQSRDAATTPPVRKDEKTLLKMYSNTLIRKLEEKALQLEQANRALKKDIAERATVTAALQDSETEFRVLTESIPHIVWITRPDGWHIGYNQKWFDYTGLTLEQSLGGGWNPAFHPDDQTRAAKIWGNALKTGEPYEIEYRLRRADGTFRWMLGRALPLRDRTGAIIKWFGTCTDIDDLKRAEEMARRSEHVQLELARQLKAAQSVAKVGSWVTDLKTFLVEWSVQTYRIFEVNSDLKPTHQIFLDMVHPDDRDRVDATFTRSIGQHTSNMIEHRIVTPDGRIKFIEERWQIVYDASGKPLRATGTCQDITERRLLEEQLRQSQRLESVGQLTGGIAHDFNNLLTVILGNAELISEQLESSPKLKALADMISNAAQRGADLTQRLLAFARKQMLAPQAVDVNVLMNGMKELLRRTLGEHIEIDFIAGSDLWSALVDPIQLESGLLNLCLNARDAMRGGGKLTIETRNVTLDEDYTTLHMDLMAGEYVLVAVSDTGCGMSPDVLARVFEPFFTTKEKGKGTGLGLAMVYGFIKQSGGHINIYSEPGQGTTVKLYLPLYTSVAGTRPVTNREIVLTGGAETILLVEDEPMVREYAREQLRLLGYSVLEAENGVKALELMREHTGHIDLLFTDVVMPGGISGKQLADEARMQRPGLKVLYTSGYTENAIIHHGRLDPGIHLLSKPYRRLELANAIRTVLES